MAAPDDEVRIIPLSRFRAQVARARRENRVDALLADPNAAALVPRLPVQELYFTIKEVGLHDAQELVALASPQQLRGCIDLDAWRHDELDVTRLLPWLDAALEAGPVKLVEVVEGLDPELAALMIRQTCRIYDLSLEDPVPEEPEGVFWPTPDSFFIIDIVTGAAEQSSAVQRLLDMLYRGDMQLARHVIMSARSEVTAELEEWSQRWRANRLADLGYIEYYDALSVYAPIEPASVRLDEKSQLAARMRSSDEEATLPTGLLTSIDQRAYFARALAGLTDEHELERLEGLVMQLANKAMSADRVDPGDVEAARRTLERAMGYLSIGLEYVVRSYESPDGEDALALTALHNIAPERLFRLGHHLVARLQTLAATLIQRGLLQLPGVPLPLADGAWADLLRALAERRPLFPRSLENATGTRPYESLVDIRRAADAIEQLAQISPWLFGLFGKDAIAAALHASRHLTPAADVRHGTLMRTAVANWMRGGGFSLTPLLPRTLRQLLDGPPPSPPEVLAALAAAGPPASLPPFVAAWLAGWPAAWSAPGGVLTRFSWLR